jgi:MYXO-CTERM domain-containing protein
MAHGRQRYVQVDADAEGELDDQPDQDGQAGLPQAGLAGLRRLRRRRGYPPGSLSFLLTSWSDHP